MIAYLTSSEWVRGFSIRDNVIVYSLSGALTLSAAVDSALDTSFNNSVTSTRWDYPVHFRAPTCISYE
ncbi:hypothetical protein PROFUN_12404 [Planoprotostelium fungivorum]|uniref:Uncharacterized protein n=1 Tax=Planoprotostelium fungivorum TaxID=1890364 RepID=A0A2P6N7J1_9EUKA|nr:hypothetical protein PROFUN_12404 [Planoprotostelium fungivorum]